LQTSVLVFLHGKKELNLTASEDAGEWDSYVYNVDLVQPNKTAALGFLDGNGTAPGRYAKATVFFSTTDQVSPIGPLDPVSPSSLADCPSLVALRPGPDGRTSACLGQDQ
jgi:hypothetical protein